MSLFRDPAVMAIYQSQVLRKLAANSEGAIADVDALLAIVKSQDGRIRAAVELIDVIRRQCDRWREP